MMFAGGRGMSGQLGQNYSQGEYSRELMRMQNARMGGAWCMTPPHPQPVHKPEENKNLLLLEDTE